MKKKLVSGLLVAAMSLSMLAGSIVSFADEATDAVLKDGDTTEYGRVQRISCQHAGSRGCNE